MLRPIARVSDKKPGMLSLMASVLAAAIGVQSKEKLEQDFSQSSPMPFIIAGVVFTALFVVGLIFIVKLVVN